MDKIYLHQTKLRIERTVNQVITAATCLIKYRKPSGETGSWNAVISDAATGTFYFDVVSADTLDESGDWITWAHVTFADTRVAAGDYVVMTVFEEGY